MMDEIDGTPPHIGILAGTAEGAALCYRMLSREAHVVMRPRAQPEITVHTFPLPAYLELIDRDDWQGVAALASRSAAKLAQAGAEVIICPNNTLHQAFNWITSPVPWLHIAAVVADEAAHRRLRRLGLLGTRTVMEGSVYSSKLRQHNIDWVIPRSDDRMRIQEIIRTELIAGHFSAASRGFFQRVIVRMASQGAEAVILACTELPLLLSEDQSALPFLDSSGLLARAALQHTSISHAVRS